MMVRKNPVDLTIRHGREESHMMRSLKEKCINLN